MPKKFTNALTASVYRAAAVDYLKRWYFIPYFYGGDDPLKGIDCSGLIVEGLKAVGMLGERDDYSAQGLYDLFKDREIHYPTAGCLVFWKRPSDGRIVHVGMMIDDRFFIHAASGDSTTTDLESAIAKNAYVKMRELESYMKARLSAYGQTAILCDPFRVLI